MTWGDKNWTDEVFFFGSRSTNSIYIILHCPLMLFYYILLLLYVCTKRAVYKECVWCACVCVCVCVCSVCTILVKHIWVARSGDFLGELCSRQKDYSGSARQGAGFGRSTIVCVCVRQKSPGVSIKPLFLSSRWWYIARLRIVMSSIHTLLT